MLNIFNYSTDKFPVNYPETIIEKKDYDETARSMLLTILYKNKGVREWYSIRERLCWTR